MAKYSIFETGCRDNPQSEDDRVVIFKTVGRVHDGERIKGSYPTGMTEYAVQKQVAGPFGGRFEEFGYGEFTYIRYIN